MATADFEGSRKQYAAQCAESLFDAESSLVGQGLMATSGLNISKLTRQVFYTFKLNRQRWTGGKISMQK